MAKTLCRNGTGGKQPVKPATQEEEMMAGILDFLTDVGGNRDLAGKFMGVVASPDCTRQDLLDFFAENSYADVSPADVGKLMAQREKIKGDFSLPGNVDY
jgi:hypothetical protein